MQVSPLALRRALPGRQRGVILIALLALLALGTLFVVVSTFSPQAIELRRQEATHEALTQARDALLGYVLEYRERKMKSGNPSYEAYGYFPLPDLGTSRNENNLANSDCKDMEGCSAMNFDGNGGNVTVIGRFPWRTLGTGPLRDGHGECLWYAVSGSHQMIQKSLPMNWDAVSHLQVVTASNSAELASNLPPHDRPIAVVFAPGPALGDNLRQRIKVNGVDVDNVDVCGGNYNVAEYLDPAVIKAGNGTVSLTSDLGATRNYFVSNAGQPILSAQTARDSPKAISVQGPVYAFSKNSATVLAKGCGEQACKLVANDHGVTITADNVFGALRNSPGFRTDINMLLGNMVGCLRDQIVAGTFRPIPVTMQETSPVYADPATPPYKSAGRIYSNPCYGDDTHPKGYFSHYRDQIFVAACPTGKVKVGTDGTCAGALIFSNQRGTDQIRVTAENRSIPANYLEGDNLNSLNALKELAFDACTGTADARPFSGASTFASLGSGQARGQDIVLCIPGSPSLAVTAPQVTNSVGSAITLARFDPSQRGLTLGSADVATNYGTTDTNLYACSWTPETQAVNGGLRSYFRFRIRRVGEGFTFAVVDGERNGTDACGAARQHLGYSGNNGISSYIQPPKLAIEFDTSRQCSSGYIDAQGRPACRFVETGSTLSNGRNDPCYTSSCGGQGLDNSSHVAVVYWGGFGSSILYPEQDDNVHGQADDGSAATASTPMPSDTSLRPAPLNPAAVLPYVAPPAYPDTTSAPGIAPLDRMGSTNAAKREFHARLELNRSFDATTNATAITLAFWIEPHKASSISTMVFSPGTPPTLSVTTSDNHGFTDGETVVIKDAVPTGFNGEYPITVTASNQFIATLPAGATNPGSYISSITWTDYSSQTDRATVRSPGHGLSTGDTIAISGAVPNEYNGTWTVTRIDANSYYFGLELAYEPGDMPPAIAAAKSLTPLADALANTSRPMSQLYPTQKPLLAHNATFYDEQGSPCASTAPRCAVGEACAADGMCYRPVFRNLRLGFTTSERPTTSLTTARGQLIDISGFATTWLP